MKNYSPRKKSEIKKSENLILPAPEQLVTKTWTLIPLNIKIAFFSTFFIGFIVHGYIFSNLILNHDGLGGFNLYDHNIENSRLGLGRFFALTTAHLKGSNVLPWVTGILSLLIISVTVCIIIAVLKLRTKIASILVGIVFITFPTAASIFAYAADTLNYYISIFLALLGVYIAERFKSGYLISGVFFCLSLGIYQSEIFFASGLYIIILMLDILYEKSNIKEIIFKAIKFLSSLIIGLILYFIILKICLLKSNSTLLSYQGIDQMGKFEFAQIPNMIITTYVTFIKFFYKPHYQVNSPTFLPLKTIFILIGIMSIVMLVSVVISKCIYKKRFLFILLIMLGALFPLATNGVYLMSPKSVHLLMIFPYVLVFVFGICLFDAISINIIDKTKSFFLKNALVLLCYIQILLILASSYNYYIYINQGYLKGQVGLMKAYHFNSSLLQDIETHPEYISGMKIIMLGKVNLDRIWPQLDRIGILGIIDSSYYFNMYSYNNFTRVYFGVSLNILLEYNNKDWINEHLDIIKDIPLYPEEDSIKVIDGIMVVKFEDQS